jgi:hypothetical protein
MPDRDNPAEQEAQRRAALEEQAEKDRRFSRIWERDVMTLSYAATGKILEERHFRGGIPLLVRYPNGSIVPLSSDDIVHMYGVDGRIETRFVARDLPEGYTVVNRTEFQQRLLNRVTNRPQPGNLKH